MTMYSIKKVKEVMVGARDLLNNEEQWTKGAYARSLNNTNVEPSDKHACKWCIMGAFMKVAKEIEGVRFDDTYDAFKMFMLRNGLGESISGWNDRPSTTHKDMIDTLDLAIRSHDQPA